MNSLSSSALPPLPPMPEYQRDQPRPICDRHGCEMELWAVPPVVSAQQAVGWQCPKCGEESVARQVAADHERTDHERAQSEQQRKQEQLEKRLGQACIPARFRDFSFDSFLAIARSEKSVTNCATLRSYSNRWRSMRERGISVLLVGGTGTGKSGLACSVANAIISDHAATALFLTAYGAVRHMRDTWGRRGKTEREALDDLLTPDLLILDEVGASVGTESETASLFEVINGRYGERKPTILIANLPMDDYQVAGNTRPGLRTYLGPRIVDRFRDDGSFTLAFDSQSLRGAAR
jgi:DNA replication protein DnaC